MSQQRYSDHYIQICNATETQATEILGRPLTRHERTAIWEAATLTWLEIRVQVPMIEKPDSLEATLASAADDLDGRLSEMIESLAGLINTMMDRQLSADERQQLNRIPDVLAVMQIGEDLTAADPDRRETLLRQMLSEL